MDYLGSKGTGVNRIPTYAEVQQGLASITAISAAINTTETNLASVTIKANALAVGTTFRIIVFGTCTSSAANASNLRVRIGTAGTSADVIAASITTTGVTSGTSVPFTAEFHITIRTIGSAGTLGGNGVLLNNGVTGISNAAVVVGTPTSGIAINTTVQNILHVSYVSAATTTTSTFQIGGIFIEEL